jgi:hypothetical protein
MASPSVELVRAIYAGWVYRPREATGDGVLRAVFKR